MSSWGRPREELLLEMGASCFDPSLRRASRLEASCPASSREQRG